MHFRRSGRPSSIDLRGRFRVLLVAFQIRLGGDGNIWWHGSAGDLAHSGSAGNLFGFAG